MALANPSFEAPGALPGEAQHWTLTAVTSAQLIAGFGIPEEAWEGFERWSKLLDSLSSVVTARALFHAAGQGFDDFDRGWLNDRFLFEFSPGVLSVCRFHNRDDEDFERDWVNDTYAFSWFQVTSVLATFGGDARVEAFEKLWSANETFARDWSNVTAAVARFDGAAQSLEDFENAWPSAKSI